MQSYNEVVRKYDSFLSAGQKKVLKERARQLSIMNAPTRMEMQVEALKGVRHQNDMLSNYGLARNLNRQASSGLDAKSRRMPEFQSNMQSLRARETAQLDVYGRQAAEATIAARQKAAEEEARRQRAAAYSAAKKRAEAAKAEQMKIAADYVNEAIKNGMSEMDAAKLMESVYKGDQTGVDAVTNKYVGGAEHVAKTQRQQVLNNLEDSIASGAIKENTSDYIQDLINRGKVYTASNKVETANNIADYKAYQAILDIPVATFQYQIQQAENKVLELEKELSHARRETNWITGESRSDLEQQYADAQNKLAELQQYQAIRNNNAIEKYTALGADELTKLEKQLKSERNELRKSAYANGESDKARDEVLKEQLALIGAAQDNVRQQMRADAYTELQSVTAKADFATRAQVGATVQGNSLHQMMTVGVTPEMESLAAQNNARGNRIRSEIETVGLMTEDEKATYNYYLSQSQEAADEYMKQLETYLNERRVQQLEQMVETKLTPEEGKPAWLGPVVQSIASVLVSPVELVGTLYSVKQKLIGEDIDPYHGTFAASIYKNAVREGVSDTISKQIYDRGGPEELASTLAFGYQTLMSVADNLYYVMIGSGVGASVEAFGGSAKAVKTVREIYQLGSMSMGAAAMTTQSLMARGVPEDKAFTVGIMAGAFEALFEKASLDNLLDMPRQQAVPWLRRTLTQAGIEASEEFCTEIANTITNVAVLAGQSDYNLAVAYYMRNGMSQREARAMAFMDIIVQVGLAAAGGFLSGGLMGGATSLRQDAQTRSRGRAIQAGFNGGTQSLLDEAQTVSDAKVQRLFAKLSNAYKNNETLSNMDVGRLDVLMDAATQETFEQNIDAMVKEGKITAKQARQIKEDPKLAAEYGYSPEGSTIAESRIADRQSEYGSVAEMPDQVRSELANSASNVLSLNQRREEAQANMFHELGYGETAEYNLRRLDMGITADRLEALKYGGLQVSDDQRRRDGDGTRIGAGSGGLRGDGAQSALSDSRGTGILGEAQGRVSEDIGPEDRNLAQRVKKWGSQDFQNLNIAVNDFNGKHNRQDRADQLVRPVDPSEIDATTARYIKFLTDIMKIDVRFYMFRGESSGMHGFCTRGRIYVEYNPARPVESLFQAAHEMCERTEILNGIGRSLYAELELDNEDRALLKQYNAQRLKKGDGIADENELVCDMFGAYMVKRLTGRTDAFDPILGKGHKRDIDIAFETAYESAIADLENAEPETKELFAYHNMKFDEVRDALKKGKMVMRSLAVSKQGSNKFGEISFLFKKNSIDPEQDSRNLAYSDDAWTPQQYKVKKNPVFDEAKTAEWLSYARKTLGPVAGQLFNISQESFEEQTREMDGVLFVAHRYNPGMQAVYALETGLVESIPMNSDGTPNIEQLLQWLDERINEHVEWGKYRRWMESLSDNLIKSHDEETNEDVLSNMEKQAPTAKPFRLTSDGSLILPVVEYDNIEDMRQNSYRLDADSTSLKELHKGIAKKFLAWATDVSERTGVTYKTVINAINIASRGRYNSNNIVNAFSDFGIQLTTAEAQTLQDLYHEGVELPAEYYEVKPHRLIDMSEVQTAIVPSNTDQDIIDGLKKRGISVVVYEAKNLQDRIQKTDMAAQDLKFSSRSYSDPQNQNYRELVAEKERAMAESETARKRAARILEKQGMTALAAQMSDMRKEARRHRAELNAILAATERTNRAHEREVNKLTREYVRDTNRLEATIAKKNETIAAQKAEMKRMKVAERVKLQATRARINERHDKEKSLRSAKKSIKALKQMLVAPNKDAHVPSFMRSAVADLISLVDIGHSPGAVKRGGGSYKETTEVQRWRMAVSNLRDSLTGTEDTKTSPEFEQLKAALPENFVEDISTFISVMTNSDVQHLADMSSAELRELKRIISTVRGAVDGVNRVYSSIRYKTVADLGSKTIEDSRGKVAKGSTETDWMRKFFKSQMLDLTSWGHTVGASGNAVTSMLSDGYFDKTVRRVRETQEFMESLYKKYGFSNKEATKWGNETHAIKLASEETVHLSTTELMELYGLSFRPQAMNHILFGGIKSETKGNDAQHPYKVTEGDLDTMFDLLTDKQTSIVDEMQQFMSTTVSEWGNEVTQRLYLYDAFGEEYYWPIRSAEASHDTKDPEKVRAFNALLNSSFTKQLTPNANSPIQIGDAFTTFVDHCSQMANYNGLAVPIQDSLKWLNYKARNDDGTVNHDATVKTALNRIGGREAESYIVEFIKDLNGINSKSRTIALAEKLTANAKRAAIAAKVRVVIQQPTAVIRATSMIDPKYFATAKQFNVKRAVKEMQTYAPIAWWKSNGNYEIGLGQTMRGMIMGDATLLEGFSNKLMKPAGLADDLGWSWIWNAVKQEAKANTNLTVNSPEFFEHCAKRFTEVCSATQVIDTPLHRSEIMRSKDSGVKQLTAFMSEPAKNYNIMYRAVLDVARKRPGSVKKFGRTAGAVIAAQMVNALVTALWDAARKRGDDEEETFRKLFGKTWVSNFTSGINPLSNMPFFADVWDMGVGVVKGEENVPTRMDMDSINSAFKAVDSFFTTMFHHDESRYTTYYAVTNLAKQVSNIFGLPVNGVISSIEGVVDIIFPGLIRRYKPQMKQEWQQEMYDSAMASGMKPRDFYDLYENLGGADLKTADKAEILAGANVTTEQKLIMAQRASDSMSNRLAELDRRNATDAEKERFISWYGKYSSLESAQDSSKNDQLRQLLLADDSMTAEEKSRLYTALTNNNYGAVETKIFQSEKLANAEKKALYDALNDADEMERILSDSQLDREEQLDILELAKGFGAQLDFSSPERLELSALGKTQYDRAIQAEKNGVPNKAYLRHYETKRAYSGDKNDDTGKDDVVTAIMNDGSLSSRQKAALETALYGQDGKEYTTKDYSSRDKFALSMIGKSYPKKADIAVKYGVSMTDAVAYVKAYDKQNSAKAGSGSNGAMTKKDCLAIMESVGIEKKYRNTLYKIMRGEIKD